MPAKQKCSASECIADAIRKKADIIPGMSGLGAIADVLRQWL